MTHQNFAPVPPAAHAPAQRPFYKKKRYVVPAGVLLLGIMLGSCSGGVLALPAGRPFRQQLLRQPSRRQHRRRPLRRQQRQPPRR